MSVTVFEDPCPQPGHSVQEFINKLLKKKRREEDKQK